MVAESGKGWRLTPSLVKLMDEVDQHWPDRSTATDGSIGDTSHAARASEHNPDHDSDGMPTGMVSAVDITKDSAAQMEAIRKALIADPRTWYVIHNGYIWSRTHDWAKRKYDGASPHTHHLHVSLMQTAAAANSTKSWGIGKTAAPKPTTPTKPKPEPKPTGSAVKPGSRTLKEGSEGKDVELVQRFLGLKDDGVFGPLTRTAVRKYQKMRGLKSDGIVGPATWKPILGAVKGA